MRGLTVKEALAQESPGQFVDVFPVPLLTPPHRHYKDGNQPPLDAVDDSVALTDSADRAMPRKLARQRLAEGLRAFASSSTRATI